MNVLVIGMGYVGTTLSLVLAKNGHQITGVDIDSKKISSLEQGKIYFHEPGLQDLLEELLLTNRLSFSTDVTKAIKENDIIFICVGTPSLNDGSADLQYIKSAAETIGQNVNKDKIVIIKSTVPVGTNEACYHWIKEANKTKYNVEVVSNPEFLREGNALYDALHPDRVVIGSENEKSIEVVKKLYEDVECPIICTTQKGAELIKYTANAFLALKISFINELAKLCDAIGINVQDIAKGIGTDHRIGNHFLNASLGYGGSCFPKDVSALLKTAESYQVPLNIIKEAVHVNQIQPQYLYSLLKEQLVNLNGKKIAVLGLSFKPHTDDIRESPAINIIHLLEKEKAIIHAHDPVVKGVSLPVKYFHTVEQAILETDAIVICTDWPEYRQLAWQKIKENMRGNAIFDGRNMLNSDDMKKLGFYYKGIGY